MAGFHIASGLSGDEISVALLIEGTLHLIEGWIWTGLIGLVIPQAVLPVPVHVLIRSCLVDVFRMGHVELTVVVFGVIDAVLSRTAIVTGHPLLCCSHGITSVSHFFFAVAFFISE